LQQTSACPLRGIFESFAKVPRAGVKWQFRKPEGIPDNSLEVPVVGWSGETDRETTRSQRFRLQVAREACPVPYGLDPVGKGHAAAGFRADFAPGVAAVDGTGAAAGIGIGAAGVAIGLAAGFLAAFFLAAGFFLAAFFAGFFADFLAAFFFAGFFAAFFFAGFFFAAFLAAFFFAGFFFAAFFFAAFLAGFFLAAFFAGFFFAAFFFVAISRLLRKSFRLQNPGGIAQAIQWQAPRAGRLNSRYGSFGARCLTPS
jgi:hypothetical protein